MPTLCLFLLPPSPAHPGALYLASSRTGCASIRRSRAGQDPQAPPPLPHIHPYPFVVSPLRYCICFRPCCSCVSSSPHISTSHPESSPEQTSFISDLSASLPVCLAPLLFAPSSLFIRRAGKKCPLTAGLDDTGQRSNSALIP